MSLFKNAWCDHALIKTYIKSVTTDTITIITANETEKDYDKQCAIIDSNVDFILKFDEDRNKFYFKFFSCANLYGCDIEYTFIENIHGLFRYSPDSISKIKFTDFILNERLPLAKNPNDVFNILKLIPLYGKNNIYNPKTKDYDSMNYRLDKDKLDTHPFYIYINKKYYCFHQEETGFTMYNRITDISEYTHNLILHKQLMDTI